MKLERYSISENHDRLGSSNGIEPDVKGEFVGFNDYEKLREYAFEVSKALTGLTVGGSEFFTEDKLGFFKADIPACVKNIEWRMEQRAKLAVARALHTKEPDNDDGGWLKHTAFYWSRNIDGDNLHYWPSRKRWQYSWQYRGTVSRSLNGMYALINAQKESLSDAK